jgi:hypothetical protein
MMPESFIVVCAPAGSRLKAPGSKFDRLCADCGARLMVPPSGQQFLKTHAGAKTICIACFRTLPVAGMKVDLAATPEVILEECASAVPNDWRDRN